MSINPSDRVYTAKNFVRVRGKTKKLPVQLAANTAVESGAAVTNNGSGRWVKATSTSVGALGIVTRTVLSTDADYAAGAFVTIEVPVDGSVEFRATRGSGTLVAGTYADLADEKTIAASVSTKKHLFVKEIIDSNTATVIFAGNLVGGAFPTA